MKEKRNTGISILYDRTKQPVLHILFCHYFMHFLVISTVLLPGQYFDLFIIIRIIVVIILLFVFFFSYSRKFQILLANTDIYLLFHWSCRYNSDVGNVTGSSRLQ
jgi:hypothetical protein